MPLAIAATPAPVPAYGGFDYVTVDQARHRVYAAHTRSDRLLIVDAASGAVTGQVQTGPMHGSAVDPATGTVFTGNGTDNTVSKIDPVAMKVLASVTVTGPVDAIAYDPKYGRIYADEDSGGDVYVIDGATMKNIATIKMPADDLESLAVDPSTGIVYQNLTHGGGFAVVDPATLKVKTIVKTPGIENNHPLVFSKSAGQIVVGGSNGVLSAYTPDGEHVGDVQVQPRIDQCGTGSEGKLVVCAGRGIVTVVAVKKGAAPELVGKVDTGHMGIHTVGIDESDGSIWVVWSDEKGDWVQKLQYTP